MPKWTKAALGGLGILIAGLSVRAGCQAVTSDATGTEILAGRVWIDHAATKPDEFFDVFVAIASEDGKGQGVFSHTSQFEGSFSVFDWQTTSDSVLSLLLLQPKTKHTVKFKATKCDLDGFDYCLDLEGAPKGPRKYVSKRGWELRAENADEVPAELRAWARDQLGD